MRIFEEARAFTFDCYGTLVDWESGILTALREFVPGAITDGDLLLSFSRWERVFEQPPYRSYRRVLSGVAHAMAEDFSVRIDDGVAERFAASVPQWPPFAETQQALLRLQKFFRLAVLSNVDRDLFAGTQRALGVEFDAVVTAEDVGSYKPALPHFERGLAELSLRPDQIVHVGESLFHDVAPARALGFHTVWIHRAERQRASGPPIAEAARPDLEVPSLLTLADAAGA